MSTSSFSVVNTAIGTTAEILVSPGLNKVIAMASNPAIPGTASMTLPTGTTGQRGGILGSIRMNTTIPAIEATLDGATWVTLAGGGGGPILTVTGTPNRITVTSGPNPVIDIAATYVGQTSITTLGTISTGVWAATAISEIHGGTNQTTYTLGDTLYSSAANTLSKLSGNTTAAIQYLAQTGTGAVSAAPVWTTISGGDITGAALTKTDDTNVTMTLGGTPATSLLRAASMTLGWTGQLSLTRGGSNASLTASNGGIVWSNATQMQILAGTATARQMLQSGATATPAWSTSTWPATTTTSQLLYSSTTNTVAGLATANNGILVTDGSGVPSISSTPPTAVLNNIPGRLKSFQILTTGTAATYTTPPNVTAILVECIGGGAGGGGVPASTGGFSSAGGGGAGGYCRKYIASPAATYTYTIGPGGNGGTAGNNNGSPGTATTFSGGTLSAGGGAGGSSAATFAVIGVVGGAGGTGGTSSNGDINFSGAPGSAGLGASGGGGASIGGTGGNTAYGGGAYAGSTTGAAGANATANSGAGGSGAASANTASTFAGGNGGSGQIIVWEFS